MMTSEICIADLDIPALSQLPRTLCPNIDDGIDNRKASTT